MIHIATTTIGVLRPELNKDSHRPLTRTLLVIPEYPNGIRAHITRLSRLTSGEDLLGGQKEVLRKHMVCDPFDLLYIDHVKDFSTGDIYEVTWTQTRRNLTIG